MWFATVTDVLMLNTMCCVGKYNSQVLPKGPRAALFKKLLQDSEPLLSTLKEVARYRKKSMSQVSDVPN
jgi:hypothetical protein